MTSIQEEKDPASDYISATEYGTVRLDPKTTPEGITGLATDKMNTCITAILVGNKTGRISLTHDNHIFSPEYYQQEADWVGRPFRLVFVANAGKAIANYVSSGGNIYFFEMLLERQNQIAKALEHEGKFTGDQFLDESIKTLVRPGIKQMFRNSGKKPEVVKLAEQQLDSLQKLSPTGQALKSSLIRRGHSKIHGVDEAVYLDSSSVAITRDGNVVEPQSTNIGSYAPARESRFNVSGVHSSITEINQKIATSKTLTPMPGPDLQYDGHGFTEFPVLHQSAQKLIDHCLGRKNLHKAVEEFLSSEDNDILPSMGEVRSSRVKFEDTFHILCYAIQEQLKHTERSTGNNEDPERQYFYMPKSKIADFESLRDILGRGRVGNILEYEGLAATSDAIRISADKSWLEQISTPLVSKASGPFPKTVLYEPQIEQFYERLGIPKHCRN